MRQQGRLTQWNDARGFGFITPLAGGPRVFVHISEFPHARQRPVLHSVLTYELGRDEQGRLRARNVQQINSAQPKPDRRKRMPAALVGVVLVASLLMLSRVYSGMISVSSTRSAARSLSASDQAISHAFQHQQSGVQVAGSGVVERVLPDDSDGSRHQRFILRLASGQTLLVAHNIDIAPHVADLKAGDQVGFYGEYEWNAEGGVIHWTHHDPAAEHVSGWLKFNGQVYQ